MKNITFFILFLALNTTNVSAQSNDTWFSFYNADSTLVGFKDINGIIKIDPKFSGPTIAKKFEHIIAVAEESNGQWKSYYLTKTGKKVGAASLHYFDNGVDCEMEGFIRFRDNKTDKVGLFDKDGKIAIPAEYNWLSQVKNGMLTGLKDGKKKSFENGEHYTWVGGNEMLIDTQNTILVNDFKTEKYLNFFSIQKTEKPSTDKTRTSFKAKENVYYTFVDYELEFKQWLTNDLLVNLTPEKLINASFETITWESKDGWATTNKAKYISDNFAILKKGLLDFTKPKSDYFISVGSLNQFMYEGDEFEKYYNTCGEANEWKYPALSLNINHIYGKILKQDNFEFLRTDDGYKLISVTIRNLD